MKRIIVVGGGPAGMMAAAVAANHGARVVLLEKHTAVGKKLAITGKGRCNLTSAAGADRFMTGYACNGRFLFSALHEFSNFDLINFFAEHGLECKVERGQRVFPKSDQAADVVHTLYQNLVHEGVELKKNMPVKGLYINNKILKGVETEQGRLESDSVIIATGGMSYPGTGSTGDGYSWAQTAGHHIIEPRPGLVPLITSEKWVKELQGLSLKNVRASSYREDGKKINEEFGEMLFTHFGLSGPIILSMSRDIGEYLFLSGQKAKLLLDLKPALDEPQLDQRLQKDLAKNSRRRFKNALDELLPRKLIPVVINLSQIDPEKECHQITRDERRKLLLLLKKLELTIVKTRPLAEAIVTAGGIDIKEVNPRTMESRLLKGLFFAGEVLDVDGYTGGFNLQAAFSTGFLAGKNAALL